MLKKIAFVLLAALGIAGPVAAQGPTRVQQDPQDFRASVVCPEVRGATPQTLTIPAGQGYFYLRSLHIEAYASGGAAQTGSVGHFTTTNFPSSGGTAVTLSAIPLTAQPAGTVMLNDRMIFGDAGVRMPAPGTATTIVSPTATNTTVHMVACGYYNPL